ncbi:MAG: helix-turn-helix transcriptional regulator [Clostridia bacterium]|jgi:transcriptional regulator with XRE-family HTH domain|nr:helix-turn-helix transcriptional regulator [Clostridia bacterium]
MQERDYRANFAAYLKQYIKDNNLSINQLAVAVELPRQTVTRYVNSERLVTVENLCKFADFFHEDLEVLLGRREY